jgi:hypothetical protein
MSVCTNLDPGRPSRLVAYTGCNAARTFARAARTSIRTRNRRLPYLLPIVPMSLCTNVGPDCPAVWPPMLYVWFCAHVCALCSRINAHSRSPTPITFAHYPNECLYQFGARWAQPFGRLCWICEVAHMFARVAHTSIRTCDRRPP